MALSDNPGQGNRGGQEYGEDSFHKSSRNQDSQKHQTTPEEEELKQVQHDIQHREEERDEKDKDKKDEKFSPGEPDDYDAGKFSTD